MANGNPEEMPHVSDSSSARPGCLNLLVCAYSHILFFLLINSLLVSLISVSLWELISTKQMGQGLVAGH